ncbi:MAG: hypothetical protein ACK4IS_03820 [Erythrobacter sp.]
MTFTLTPLIAIAVGRFLIAPRRQAQDPFLPLWTHFVMATTGRGRRARMARRLWCKQAAAAQG